MSSASIVVSLVATDGNLRAFTDAVDRLTTPVTAFDLVVECTNPDSRDELAAWSRYRPNVRVVEAEPEASTAGGLSPALAAALGRDAVLRLTPADLLAPGGLEALLGVLDRTGADAVAGRIFVPGRPADYDDDQPVQGVAAAATSSAGVVWLIRTDRLRRDDEQWWLPSEDWQLSEVVNPAVAVRPSERSSGSGGSDEVVAEVRAGWVDGRLRLDGSIPAGVAALAERLRLSLVDPVQRAAYLISAHLGAVDESPADRRGFVAEIDPFATAAGGPLTPGTYTAGLEVAGAGQTISVRLPGVPATPALIEDTFVVAGGGPQLSIEFAPAGGRIPALDATTVTVTESPRGSLLTAPMPDLHVARSAGVDSVIRVGQIDFPGRLVVEDGTAQLRTFVSGLPGTAAISIRFGPGGHRPTGLSLRIDGVGQMAVVETPPPPPKAPPAAAKPAAKPAAKKAPAKKPARKKPAPKKAVPPPRRGAVAKLRRALPRRLDPVARRLSRVPALRKVYRSLTRAR